VVFVFGSDKTNEKHIEPTRIDGLTLGFGLRGRKQSSEFVFAIASSLAETSNVAIRDHCESKRVISMRNLIRSLFARPLRHSK